MRQKSVSTENTFMRGRIWTLASTIRNAKCPSPDGLVGKNALREVKCLFTQRDSTREEAIVSEVTFT